MVDEVNETPMLEARVFGEVDMIVEGGVFEDDATVLEDATALKDTIAFDDATTLEDTTVLEVVVMLVIVFEDATVLDDGATFDDATVFDVATALEETNMLDEITTFAGTATFRTADVVLVAVLRGKLLDWVEMKVEELATLILDAVYCGVTVELVLVCATGKLVDTVILLWLEMTDESD